MLCLWEIHVLWRERSVSFSHYCYLPWIIDQWPKTLPINIDSSTCLKSQLIAITLDQIVLTNTKPILRTKTQQLLAHRKSILDSTFHNSSLPTKQTTQPSQLKMKSMVSNFRGNLNKNELKLVAKNITIKSHFFIKYFFLYLICKYLTRYVWNNNNNQVKFLHLKHIYLR